MKETFNLTYWGRFPLGKSPSGKGMGKRMKEYAVLFRMIAKRLLCRFSFFVCLAAMILLSFCLRLLEKETETAVSIGIYTEDAALWEPVFANEERLFKFYFLNSEEELERDVVKGKAECGYVLQEDLQNKFEEGNWEWAVTVYRSSGTMLDKLINETVFSKIFHVISSTWYEGYIADKANLPQEKREEAMRRIRELLDTKRTDGSVFTVEERYVTTEGVSVEAEKVSVFPVRGIAFTGIFLCGLLGAMQALGDRYENTFRNRNAAVVAAADVAIPASMGMVAGFLSLGAAMEEIPYLCLCFVLVTVFAFVLQWVVRTREVMAALLPFLVFAGLAGCYLLRGVL